MNYEEKYEIDDLGYSSLIGGNSADRMRHKKKLRMQINPWMLFIS